MLRLNYAKYFRWRLFKSNITDKNVQNLIFYFTLMSNCRVKFEYFTKKYIHAEITKLIKCEVMRCGNLSKDDIRESFEYFRGTEDCCGLPKKFITLYYLMLSSSLHYSSFSPGGMTVSLNEPSIFVSVPMESIQGVAGQKTILPCNIQPRESNDAVSMVLWFKEDSGEPLYR